LLREIYVASTPANVSAEAEITDVELQRVVNGVSADRAGLKGTRTFIRPRYEAKCVLQIGSA